MDATLSSALQSVAFLSGVLGQWLIARRSRHAFAAWTLSNVVLIAFALLSEAWWLLAMYSVYLAGSLYAWWRWREQPTPARQAAEQRTHNTIE